MTRTQRPTLNLAGVFEAVAKIEPERDCLIWRDQRLTWAQVSDRTDRLARLLIRSGLRPPMPPSRREENETGHDHVAVMMPNRPEFLETVIAAHKARAAPFNVNHHYGESELGALLEDARPRVIVYDSRLDGLLARNRHVLQPGVLLLRVGSSLSDLQLPQALDYDHALAEADAVALPKPQPTDIHVLYTGGTTGAPRGVMWEVGDLLAGPLGLRAPNGAPRTLDELVQHVRHRQRTAVLTAAPFMHGAGLFFALGAWCRGDTVVVLPEPDHLDGVDLVQTCIAEQVTKLLIVGPALGRKLADGIERLDKHSLPVRSVVNTGASLGSDLTERLRKLLPTVRMVDMVGASETGPEAIRTDGEPFQLSADSVVLAMDRSRLLVRGERSPGWLARKGCVPVGYLHDAARTAATFPTLDGTRYAVVGDRVELFDDGSIRLLGRDSSIINTGGEKVFAEEVERALASEPEVRDVVVLGRPHPYWGEEIVAVVEVAEGFSDDMLRSVCRRRLAPFKVPRAFLRVAEMPRLLNGKVDRRRIDELVSRSEASLGPRGST